MGPGVTIIHEQDVMLTTKSLMLTTGLDENRLKYRDIMTEAGGSTLSYMSNTSIQTQCCPKFFIRVPVSAKVY